MKKIVDFSLLPDGNLIEQMVALSEDASSSIYLVVKSPNIIAMVNPFNRLLGYFVHNSQGWEPFERHLLFEDEVFNTEMRDRIASFLASFESSMNFKNGSNITLVVGDKTIHPQVVLGGKKPLTINVFDPRFVPLEQDVSFSMEEYELVLNTAKRNVFKTQTSKLSQFTSPGKFISTINVDAGICMITYSDAFEGIDCFNGWKKEFEDLGFSLESCPTPRQGYLRYKVSLDTKVLN